MRASGRAAEAPVDGGDPAAVGGVADEAGPVFLGSESDVPLDGQVGGEVQLLVDHGDAGDARGEGVGRRERPAVETDVSGVGPQGAGKNLHQR